MEILAFTHAAEAHEDPSPTPELRELHLPSGALVTTLSTAAIAGAVMFGPADAQALVGRGDSGSAVVTVQTALVNQGYSPGAIDGVFGSSTEQALISFQTSQGLVPDGVVGPATAAALNISGPEFGTGGGGGGGGTAGTVTVSTNGGGLNGRTGPGTNYPAVAFYEDGTVLRTSGRTSNGWIETASGIWINGDWVTSGGTGGGGGGTGNATVTAGSGVNVRSGPGTNFAIIDGLPFGASVRVVSTSGGWSQLSGGGWVSSQFLSNGGGGGGGGGGAGTVTVSTNGGVLSARFGPGLDFGIGASYSNGSVLNTTGRTSGGWVELTNGLWVSGDWVI